MKLTVISIIMNHGDKMNCLGNTNMNDDCCSDEKPQTPTCKTLVQEVKKFFGEVQPKVALLPNELKIQVKSVIMGNKQN